MRHYSKAELEMYRHKEMPVLGRITCSAHLKECSICAALLKELENEDEYVLELRENLKIYEEIGKKEE